jgi:hypothetical protein
LIPSGSVLRKDGKIAPLPDTTAIINKYLTGNEMLIGDKPKLTLDQNYTYDQVSKLCAYPNLRLDLTNVAPAVKAQLSYILGKVIDTSLSENYTSVYPKLRKLDHPLTTASHTIFYDLEKKEISSMENYKWNERQRKAASYEFLRANGMDTSENRKLIEAVKFGSNYVEV